MKHAEGQFEHPQTQQAQEGELTARSTPSKKQLGTTKLEELARPEGPCVCSVGRGRTWQVCGKGPGLYPQQQGSMWGSHL